MSDEKTTAIEVVLTPEMNQAIAMADRKPRSIPSFIKESIALATMDEATAEDCLYALPRTETDPITGKKEKKTIEGPSARLAEIISFMWGNCRAEGKITDDRGEFVTAQGTFVDLEKNSGVRTEVRRRITTRRGDRYSADMVMQTGNAAISIARRNAILAGIPKVFWSKIYEAARQTVAGDSQTLINRRGKAIAHMQKLGVTVEMIIEALGVKSLEEIGLDHLVTLRGIATAIKEGETSVEEAFKKESQQPAAGEGDPKNKSAPKPGATTQKAKDALKGDSKKDGLDAASLEALKKASDQAGLAENALLEKFQVASLDVMTREQYEEAMRFVNGVIAANTPS
jgi:hypothetical protein